MYLNNSESLLLIFKQDRKRCFWNGTITWSVSMVYVVFCCRYSLEWFYSRVGNVKQSKGCIYILNLKPWLWLKTRGWCRRIQIHALYILIIALNDLHPIGKVQDYFYRVEFHQRDHHMFIWLFGSKMLQKHFKNDSQEIVDFVNKYLKYVKRIQKRVRVTCV